MALDNPQLNITGISVSTKVINASTLQEISSTATYVNVNSSQYLLLVATCSFANENLLVNRATITFKQKTSLNYGVHVFVSNSGYFVSSEELPIKTSIVNSVKTYEVDITSQVSTNYVGKHYFMITTDSQMSFYTSRAASPNAPTGSISVSDDYEEYHIEKEREKEINLRLKNLSFDLNLHSTKYIASLRILDYVNEIAKLPINLVYNISFHDTVSFDNGLLATYFPKGWKLNVQQFLYADGDDYIYIDEVFKKHRFQKPLNSTSANLYYDTSGSYLILKIVNNQYQIINSQSDVYIFSSGRLSEIKFKNSSGFYSFYLVYNSQNKLTSIKNNNNQTLVSFTYNTSNIEITLFSNTNRKYTLSLSSNSLTQVQDPSSETYNFTYATTLTSSYLSSIISSFEKIEISYDSSHKITQVNHKETRNSITSIINSYVIDKVATLTQLTIKPGGENNLRKRYLLEFDNDGNLIKEALYNSSNNGFDLAESHMTKGVKKYFFNLESSFTDLSLKDSNNNTLTLPINISNNSTVFYSNTKDSMTYLFIEIMSNFPMSSLLEDTDTLTAIVYKNDVEVGRNTCTLSFLLNRNCLFVPLDSRNELVEGPASFKIVFSHTNITSTINVTRIRSCFWNTPVVAEYCYSGSLLGFFMNIINSIFNSPSISLSINGTNGNYNVYKTDYINSYLYFKITNTNIVFSNKGRNMYLQNSGGTPLSSYRFVVDKYIRLIDKVKNYQNTDTIFYSSIDRKVINFNSDDITINSYNEDCFFNQTVSSYKKYNYNLELIEEKDTLDRITTFLYDSFGNNTSSTTSKDYGNDTIRTIYNGTKSFSNDGTMLIGSHLGPDNYSQKTFDYYSDGTLKKEQFVSFGTTIQYYYNYEGNLSRVAQIVNEIPTNVSNYITYSHGYISSFYCINNNSNINETSFVKFNLHKEESWNEGNDNFNIIYSSSGHSETLIDADQVTALRTYDTLGRISKINNSDWYESELVFSYFTSAFNPYKVRMIQEKEIDGQAIYAQNSFSYDIFGNISCIEENLFLVTFSFDAGLYENHSYHSIKKTFEYNNSVFKEEENLYFVDQSYGQLSITKFYNGSNNTINTVTSNRYLDNFTPSNAIKELITTVNNGSFSSYMIKHNLLSVPNSNHYYPFISYDTLKIGNSNNEMTVFSYQYHQSGNISSISSHFLLLPITTSYSYDSLNQLTSETTSNVTNTYQFDSQGNITQINRGGSVINITYDSCNKIDTISYGGNTYQSGYSVSGIPCCYRNNSLDWQDDRLTMYGSTYFSYDAFGRRKAKTKSSGPSTTYSYLQNRLISETKTINNVNYKLEYIYSPDDEIIGFQYEGDVYIYIKNILKDVVALYCNGNFVATYVYDAYGNHKIYNSFGIDITSSTTGVAYFNPIRYRSYYYDVETGLYYLKSRYYDPFICRFISPNASNFLSPDALFGINRYAYCKNNPIMYRDEDGRSAIASLLIAAGVGVFASVAAQLTVDVVHGALSNNWDYEWQDYLGAIIGGALSGILYASIPAIFAASHSIGVNFGIGFASSFTSSFFSNVAKMISNDNSIVWDKLLFESTAFGVLGGFSGAIVKIPNVNKGKNSIHQIYKSGLTKVWRYGWNMSAKTISKGFMMNYSIKYLDILFDLFYNFAKNNN